MDKPSSSGIYGSQQSSSGEKEVGNNFPACLCLSDDILGSILSMLNTRDAARTSVLSRRWRNLWTSTHSINFNMDEMLGIVPHVGKFMDCDLFEGGRDIEQKMLEFIGAVDQCISRYVGRGIEKFTIHMCSSKYYKHLISWVNSAIEMHVQNLELNLNGAAEPFVFPHHLFTAVRGSSVKHLSLSFCHLIQSDGFGSLKSLTLENVQLKENLFSSCLLLEVLTLQNCHGITKLKIGHPPFCLKNLKVFLTGIRLEVYAKNLVQFEFFGTREAFLYPSIDEYGSFHPFPLDTELSQSEGSNACWIYAPSPDFGGFKLLRSLALQNASFTTERLENLLANCSYLKHLTLEKCNMQLPTFTFQIAGLLHLKYLKICGCRGLMDICVCATNLEIFVFVSHYPHSYPRSNFRLLDNNGNDFSSTTNGLKQLYLQSSKFPNNLLHFSSLTTLSLEDVHLEEEYVRDLLSNCVLLEILNVTRCDDLFSLNITGTSLQLRYLSVRWCKHLQEILISAENLIRFDYHGPVVHFSLKEAPQLMTVEIEIVKENYNYCHYMMDVLSELSSRLPQLQKLIFYVEDGFPVNLPIFNSLKHLVLFVGRHPQVLHDLACVTSFLKVSPFLEKLQVELSRYLLDETSGTASSPDCFHHHLKEVELCRFRGIEKEINFAVSLLHGAKSLVLMRIDPRVKHYDGNKEWYSSEFPEGWVQWGRQRTKEQLTGRVPLHVQLAIM